MSDAINVLANEDSATGRQTLALGILQAIQEQRYITPDGRPHNLIKRNRNVLSNTRYYVSNDRRLQDWRLPPEELETHNFATDIHFRNLSTVGAVREWESLSGSSETDDDDGTDLRQRVGVLCCGSPVQPGGDFESGRRCQEAALCRGSNLSLSLSSPTARPFYEQDSTEGFHTDAMIWSRGVSMMRDAQGDWARPMKVDVVTGTPVEAATVRSTRSGSAAENEKAIERAMTQRMGKILAIFEHKRVHTLILAGFGAGLSGNKISVVAQIWVHLLGPDGRFQGKFKNVVFAISDEEAYGEFCREFRRALAS